MTVAHRRTLDPATRLRDARESRGLSLRQVADATKLSVRALESLEHGNLSELPEDLYRRSIVRAVSRGVGLDPEQLLRECSSLTPDVLPAAPVVVRAEPQAATGVNRMLTLAGAVLPLLAGTLYFGAPGDVLSARIGRDDDQDFLVRY